MERQLLHNSIQCPDGTILVSRSHHNFVEHKQDDGREYFVDGGLSYQRIGFSDEEYKDMAVYSDDPHEKIREHFEWGNNFDKDMNRLPDDHLDALVTFTADGYPDFINKVFIDEKAYRDLKIG